MTVRCFGRGRGGIEANDTVFDLCTLRDGMCVHKTEFKTRVEALAAAGLGE